MTLNVGRPVGLIYQASAATAYLHRLHFRRTSFNALQAGCEARESAFQAALDDMLLYLRGDGQVAIFDATNSTQERRLKLVRAVLCSCLVVRAESDMCLKKMF